jgi:uncharacterized protein
MKKYEYTIKALTMLLILISHNIKAQQINYKADMVIINNKLAEKTADPYKRPYIYKNDTSLIKRLNPINIIAGGTLYIYQNFLSKQISSNCLYIPSCSEFSKNAIREYGLMKGVILSADRVNRCNVNAARDLRNQKRDLQTNRYPDPVSRYKNLRKNRW